MIDWDKMNLKIFQIILFFIQLIGRIFDDVSHSLHSKTGFTLPHLVKAPFIPTRHSPTDTSNFIEIDHPQSYNVRKYSHLFNARR